MRIAVVGGTGVVGTHAVRLLTGRGHEVAVLTRSCGVDLVTGAGLDAALVGSEVVLDVSNVATTRTATSVRWFSTVAANLSGAADRAGVRHLVALSVVGVDRVDTGYHAGKRAQEEVLLAGPVPVTILRATQFHEFTAQVLGWSQGPVALVPRMRIQPIAAAEVAAALADLCAGPPGGRVPDLAGPEVLELTDAARRLVRHRGQRRVVVPFRRPGAGGRLLATGALLPAGPGPRGQQTFTDWLADSCNR